jgi:hypothetical protein
MFRPDTPKHQITNPQIFSPIPLLSSGRSAFLETSAGNFSHPAPKEMAPFGSGFFSERCPFNFLRASNIDTVAGFVSGVCLSK